MKKLNLGSGEFRKEGYINLDYRTNVGAEVVHNLDSLPLPFDDSTFELIEANHVLEHLENPFAVMRELHRISIPNGTVSIRVPHFSRGFSHPEHKRGFDVSFPFYFDPEFKGGYEGVEFKLKKSCLSWFAQPYLKKSTLSPFMYWSGVILATIFDFFANLSPFFCSRLWCFWVGGFDEILFVFSAVKK